MIPALVLVADLRTIQFSDWTEAHPHIDVSSTGGDAAIDVTTSPSAKLVWRGHTAHLQLTYQGYLGESELGLSPAPILFHSATLDTGWRGRFTQITLTESASQGLLTGVFLNSFGTQAPSGASMQQPVNGLVQNTTNVDYVSSMTTLTLTTQASSRWQLELHGSFLVSGGLTVADQQSIALQHGPSAGATATYRLSPIDSAYVHVDGTRSETNFGPCVDTFGTPLVGATTPGGMTVPADCAPDSYIGRALVGGTHAFSPVSTASLGAGVGLVEARLDPTDPYNVTPYPLVAATYEYRLKEETHRVDLRADAALSPFVDLRTGAVDDRAEVSGNMSWISGRTIVSGTLGAAATVVASELPPTQILFVTSRIDQRLDRNYAVTYGLSFYYESQEGAPGIASVIGSVGFIAETLPMRF